MAYAFDTLGYAQKLKKAGVPEDQAEAHAAAARDFVMVEIVTKLDLTIALDNLALRLTVRLGAMLVTAVGIILAVLTRLISRTCRPSLGGFS
jgi:hypothetical protein